MEHNTSRKKLKSGRQLQDTNHTLISEISKRIDEGITETSSKLQRLKSLTSLVSCCWISASISTAAAMAERRTED